MEDNETEEYKKRVKELIDKLEKEKEKNKNIPESYQQFLEVIEGIKQTSISNINATYRNKKSIMGFVIVIGRYYSLGADPKSPYEKDQFQEEIDALFKLIYEELKKPSLDFPNLRSHTKKSRRYS